jgi:RND family efflux transporter MFP subunit|tara:strand:- start:408 stop:1469 length:1062 start_codon:yes stop_codon:yes gene_type:complete
MFKEVFILFFLTFLFVSCGQDEVVEKKKQRTINITTSLVQIYNFKDQESAIGTIEGLMDPTIRSEIASSVKKIYTKTGFILKKGDLIAQLDDQDYRYQLELAEAELSQLKIRLIGQNKTYQRNAELVDQNFISPNALDEIVNQKNETEELIKISEARAKIANYRLSKTKIYSPINGKVEKQIASVGDFLKVGDPIIQIMNNDRLRAHVPFPERLATKLKPGLPIELKSPIVQEKIIVKIAELKPQLISDTLSIDVIADVLNQPNWQAGGSVRGTVVFKEIRNLSVPEQSIILRPAGQVVYVVINDVAFEKSVQTGITQNGNTEITAGLELGELIAVDGAAYLTDEAKINITQK